MIGLNINKKLADKTDCFETNKSLENSVITPFNISNADYKII
jgi:hypothetical protein